MHKMLLVLKNEFITSISRRSFLITLFLVPVASLIIFLVISVGSTQNNNQGSQVVPNPSKVIAEGYVDESGLVKALPPDIKPDRFVAFQDLAQARQALTSGKISGYFVIPPDYIKKGEIVYVRQDYSPLSALDQAGPITEVIQYNLLNKNDGLAKVVDIPISVKEQPLSPDQPQRESSNPLTFFVPYIVTMIFYIVILMSASFMLNSVTSEKQNRVMEILMVSVTPVQMLTGKIIALGLVGLLQTIVWTGTGYSLLKLTGSKMEIAAAFQLPVSILVWGGIFFILGYALYASFMAGVGALVPNLREASQATTVVIIPMIVPLIMLNALINDPNGALSVGLSLFPLTAPVAMMTRLSATEVPFWQPVVACILLAISAVFAIRAVAGMFRAQTLLAGQAFSIKLFFQALLGKA